MNILLVSERYFPFVGGLETQMRMVAHRLARHHRVEVAALSLLDNSAAASPRGGRTAPLATLLKNLAGDAFAEGSLPLRLKRALEDGLLLPAYRGYLDGEVPVHAIAPNVRQRLALFSAAMRLMRHPVWNAKWHDRHERSGRFWHRFYYPFYVPRLRALVRGKDVVHCLADGALGWAVEEAARLERVPFVITPYVHPGHHGDDEDNIALYQRADIVFALIETGRRTLIELGVMPERIRLAGVVPLLPEATDPAGFRARHGLGNSPVVLFVGRLAEYKGFQALIEAAPRVWREFPEVRFVFAGPGDEKAQQRFAELDDPRIRYLGLVSDQEKGDAYAACDLFCMPSVAEILPAVYLEAWSYGKPVIGGTAPGLRELIEGNEGGVIAEQDPASIAACLSALLRDEPCRSRTGQRGRALVAERFSEAALVQALVNAYEELARPRRRHAARRPAPWTAPASTGSPV
jgi:glycosyltransferase involved in cell wall biosynthesis